MADFVAVIRRAVDGLSNNSPEMRVKVYDKARSAVVRQLESMKPRPPEALLQRQLEKLEQAIAEVEAEHAEALPPLEEPAEQESAPPVPVPVAEEEPAVAEEAAAPEPTPEAPVADEAEEAEPESAGEEEAPAVEEPQQPAWPETEAAEDAAPETGLAETVEEDHPAAPESAEAAPEAQPEAADAGEAAPDAASEEAVYADDLPETYAAEETQAQTAPEDYQEYGPADIADWPAAEPQPEEAVAPPAAEPAGEPDAGEPPEDRAVQPEAPLFGLPEADAPFEAGTPEAAARDEEWEWPGHADEDAARREPAQDRPAEEELSSLPRVPSFEPVPRDAASSIFDEFDAYLEGKTPAGEGKAAPVEHDFSFGEHPDDGRGATTPDDEARQRDAWTDFESLIGYNGRSGEAATEPAAAAAPEETVFEEPVRPYRPIAKPRRNYAMIGLALLGILLLAGSGYALWLNRDALTSLYNGPERPSGTPVVADGNGGAAGETAAPGTDAGQGAATASDDGSVTGTKFTQRLLADGTEVDEGPATVQGAAPEREGTSVSEQNVAPPADSGAANGAAGAAGPETVAAGERMYLYEELLGQSTPTAIEGGVVWSLREEQDAEGRPEAVVQGTITVPGRGLTALVTFKRNSDPSLPASHLIEIVFSVPADFEGGAIESVQRISMKSTEQDRGNALIAVPARITDDFHMIALNDFPDARAANLELLRNRNWIDIPLTYRNGRRALLTMQKGEAGIDAFNRALAQWAAADNAAAQQQ